MSLVIEITYKNNTFLLMGDAGSKVERDILNSFSNIKVDLIKIGHHGSSYSSLESFIQEVSPKFAIISVGNNNQYGHPSEKTLETLKKYGVEIYRTDELGNIIAISDGNVIKVNSEN
jgi:competence protein ComEC